MNFSDNQFKNEKEEFKELQDKLGLDKISAKEKKNLLEKFLEQKAQLGDMDQKKRRGEDLERRRRIFLEEKRREERRLEERRRKRRSQGGELRGGEGFKGEGMKKKGILKSDRRRTLEGGRKLEGGKLEGRKLEGRKLEGGSYWFKVRGWFLGWADRIILLNYGYFSGVSNVQMTKFKKNFLRVVKFNLNQKIKDLDEMLKYPLKVGGKLRKEMFKENNDLFYDLLILYKGLRDEKILSLFDHYTKDTRLDREKMKELLGSLYRHLYIYSEYYQTLEIMIRMSIGFQHELNILNKREKDKWINLIKEDINFIFFKFLMKFHDSYSWIAGKRLLREGEVLEEELEIEEKDKLRIKMRSLIEKRKREAKFKAGGSGVEGVEGNLLNEGNLLDEGNEGNEGNLLDEGAKGDGGREWIEGLKYTKEDIEERDLAYYFEEDDKIFHIYVILEEFEKELSFIFTSNKLKFNSIEIGRDKLDVKVHFNNLYIEINQCHDKIKTYLNLLKDIRQFESDKVESNYYTKHLKGLTELKKKDNRLIRKQLLSTSEKLLYFLEKFWYEETKDLEEGFEEGMEKVYFDSIDGDQSKLEGKNAIECLSLLMDFVKYLIKKLKFGNLSGFESEVNDMGRR